MAKITPCRGVDEGSIPSEIANTFAGLAQLVEQLPCKHQVASSNPAAGTKTNKCSRLHWLLVVLT